MINASSKKAELIIQPFLIDSALMINRSLFRGLQAH